MSIMRASFVLTHRPGKRFVFTDYILAGLDEDFAKVSQCTSCLQILQHLLLDIEPQPR